MGKAKFDMLGLEFSIGLFKAYHDDGFVNDVARHLAEIDRKYGNHSYGGESWLRDNNGPLGAHVMRKGIIRTHSHICYVDTGLPSFNVAIRGHEETHAVESYDKLDLLARKVLEEQRVRINFEDVDDEEIRAWLGGIFAVYTQGMNLKGLEDIHFRDFHKARRIFENSRLPSKTIHVN